LHGRVAGVNSWLGMGADDDVVNGLLLLPMASFCGVCRILSCVWLRLA
jgi:hypothetical protein